MKKILHTKVTVKTLIKSISKNTAVISRSVAGCHSIVSQCVLYQ